MPRRAVIADAAISTIARNGMRGLTHRAVDRAAGLPQGSASYYFRTRQALLQATVERLAELTSADLLVGAAMLDGSAVPASSGHDLNALAAFAAGLEAGPTTGRERLLARYELPWRRPAAPSSGRPWWTPAPRSGPWSPTASPPRVLASPTSARPISRPSSTACCSTRSPGPEAAN